MPPFLDLVERLELVRDGFFSPDAGCHTRAAALLALDRGLPLCKVARSVRCSPSTLYRWRDRYLESRTPAALQDGRIRVERRRTARRHAARSAALRELAARAGATHGGRLPLDPPARRELARAADDEAVPPTRRYWAALLLAYDRGVLIGVIARAAVCDPRVIREAPARHLDRVLRPPTSA